MSMRHPNHYFNVISNGQSMLPTHYQKYSLSTRSSYYLLPLPILKHFNLSVTVSLASLSHLIERHSNTICDPWPYLPLIYIQSTMIGAQWSWKWKNIETIEVVTDEDLLLIKRIHYRHCPSTPFYWHNREGLSLAAIYSHTTSMFYFWLV